MPHTTSAEMKQCIDECLRCASVCLETSRHCLELGGKHAAAQHTATQQDCAGHLSDECELHAPWFASAHGNLPRVRHRLPRV